MYCFGVFELTNCMCVGNIAHAWRSEDDFGGLVLTF